MNTRFALGPIFICVAACGTRASGSETTTPRTAESNGVQCVEGRPIEYSEAHRVVGCTLATDQTFGSVALPAGTHARFRDDGTVQFVSLESAESGLLIDGNRYPPNFAINLDEHGHVTCAAGIHEPPCVAEVPPAESPQSLRAHNVPWTLGLPTGAQVAEHAMFNLQPAVKVTIPGGEFVVHLLSAAAPPSMEEFLASNAGNSIRRVERWPGGWLVVWQSGDDGFTFRQWLDRGVDCRTDVIAGLTPTEAMIASCRSLRPES